jgi:hypothetical protein
VLRLRSCLHGLLVMNSGPVSSLQMHLALVVALVMILAPASEDLLPMNCLAGLQTYNPHCMCKTNFTPIAASYFIFLTRPAGLKMISEHC